MDFKEIFFPKGKVVHEARGFSARIGSPKECNFLSSNGCQIKVKRNNKIISVIR